MKKIMISVLACFMMLVMCAGLAVPAVAAGVAPVAENLELKTYRDTSVSAMLSAYDPEGDVVSFEITTQPVKGSIELEQNGSFVYTPNEGKKGRDYFGYKALDSEGNLSQEATVIIRIEKQKKPIEYTDMENRAGEYAAVTLSERGIFTGEQLCGQYSFGPDKELSRDEFLSMCMQLSPEPVLSGYSFSEDLGVPISRTEAMQMLNDVLGLTDVDYISVDLDAEEEAVQACMNLSAVGIINEPEVSEDVLTRESAALMLVAALEIIENR